MFILKVHETFFVPFNQSNQFRRNIIIDLNDCFFLMRLCGDTQKLILSTATHTHTRLNRIYGMAC